MNLSEADTRAKLIDPALHMQGWTEDLIRREETDKGIDIVDGKPRRRQKGRIDYLLRIRININSQPVAIALIEAKRNDDPPDKGFEQAKKYAGLNNVPFVYSSNGHLFLEYDNLTGKTSDHRSLKEFPSPVELKQRYEKAIGVSFESENAKPLLIPYPGGEASSRYYQDAAIRAALTKIAKGEKKVLLYLATGSGKTFISVHILKKIAEAGQLRRALFVCDRDELRSQGLGAFQNVFGSERSHFIATTVDLITTGVDVPILRNIVFFKYVRSPISFQQMMGRGSRIHFPTNKLMFRVYDYTNATRLLGKDFISKPTKPSPPGPTPPPEKIIRVKGFDVHVNPAGTYIVTEKEGRLTMVTVEEYKEKIAKHLVDEAKTFDGFHQLWLNPQERKHLLDILPDGIQGIRLLQELLNQKECDPYDVLAEIAFGTASKSRKERIEALHYKHEKWFETLLLKTTKTLLALARQFEKGGTEEIENPYVFNAPDVVKSGGLQSLKILGEPKDIINETKKRLFAV